MAGWQPTAGYMYIVQLRCNARIRVRANFYLGPKICLGEDAALGLDLLQRVSIASYAKRCISYDRFCPTVCHSPVSCQNDSSYDHAVFTGG